MTKKPTLYKTVYNCICLVLSSILLFHVSISSAAAEDSKLMDSLKKNCMYYVTTIDGIGTKSEGLCVILYGNISTIGNNEKTLTIKDGSGQCIIDTTGKSVKSVASDLKVDDRLMVYGKVNRKGKKDEIYTVTADKIEISKGAEYETGAFIFPNKMVLEEKETIEKENVSFLIHKEWDSEKVRDYLEDNENTKGYQYYLNVLSAENYDSPELFYIFYFRKNNFLENDLKVTENKRIELAIINNILHKETPLNWFKNQWDIGSIKCGDGNDVHYYTKLCRVAENKSARLEFVFIPDEEGIVCTLYLHNANMAEHAEQVAFTIESISCLRKIE